jgi:adenine-specific DNA-methyltransferase
VSVSLYHGDCLEALPVLPANSVDCVITDPPYFRVKGEEWDRQWSDPAAFIAWLGKVVAELARVLKPNGSLYLFASPKMAARVEVMIGEHLNVLNQIVWQKELDRGKHAASDKDILRAYFPNTERIIFAEHQNPIGRFLTRSRTAAGLKGTRVDVALGYVRRKDPSKGTEIFRRWEEGSSIPTERDFCRALQACGDTRATTELKQIYAALVRPFSVSADTPYTDVWNFAPVPAYPGKHPCEKPQDMLEHMILTSTRPGAVVLDCFAGSGVTGQAARRLGRGFIGIERDARYFAKMQARLSGVSAASVVERVKRDKASREAIPQTLRMEMTV